MPADLDRYERYYADKLWAMVPAIYRTLDSATLDQSGPLRELVNRIGAQAAALRRSIDRLWEDQSIETCDDWVIPYIADLLATNLVDGLDARGQRLDTAKTVYYRRRKGTVAILEEITSDITGWDAKIVEFFRRMARTRHGLDPEIGMPLGTAYPDELQSAEGLVGSTTRTGIGGFADLRNAYGASKAHSAFDEFFHTADFRLGRGMRGWYNIPRLGVFLWKLESLGVDQTTPVPVLGCAQPTFTFDPTGRQIPLFALATRTFKNRFGDSWVSPQEFQLPVMISRFLLAEHFLDLYKTSLGVYRKPGLDYELVQNTIRDGKVQADKMKLYPEVGTFKITDGAPGPFFGTYHYGFSSRIGAGPYDRRVLGEELSPITAPQSPATGGGILAISASSGTTTISDSLTYTSVNDVTGITQLTVRAANEKRPLLRLEKAWTLNGAQGGQLFLEGLFISGKDSSGSGTDIVLSGNFDAVTLICCTFDPGSSGAGTAAPFASAVDGKALSPVRLFIDGRIRTLTLDRCIMGPVRARNQGSVDHMLISDSVLQAIPDVKGSSDVPNAIEEKNGDVSLVRSTVLGKLAVHRLHASESILNDLATVEDTQDGCVRFTAWSAKSTLPRRYESVQIASGAPLFTSRAFGQPGYGQLLATADQARIDGAPSILQGAQNGSEMGAFSREQNVIKERSLLIKFQEFTPLGLVPVIVDANDAPRPGQ
ncbi:MAG TPA: hypothetical protein VHA33_07630 [Candidatus Angelobacter sp.]|jgi:hypothetical protein|nr:hypothetical protein [Candidatus Angelobacter sp.]